HHTYGSPAAGEFEPHDIWEFVDDGGRPYRAGAAVPSDSGHALEFVGFAMRFLDSAKRKVENAAAVVPPGLVENLPRVMERNFANGFNAEAGGIVKSFDLVARRPLNSDMPWWNLPETMRAAAFCWRSSRDPEVQDASLRILAACHNAFTERFVRREIGLSAVQTRSASGEDVDVIPATSDADPGYHTGISMIDTLRVFDAAAG